MSCLSQYPAVLPQGSLFPVLFILTIVQNRFASLVLFTMGGGSLHGRAGSLVKAYNIWYSFSAINDDGNLVSILEEGKKEWFDLFFIITYDENLSIQTRSRQGQ